MAIVQIFGENVHQLSSQNRQRLVLLSPLVIIAVGRLIASLAGVVFGIWVWIPMTLVVWGMFAFMIAWGGGREATRRWLQAPQGAWGWSVLAVAVGLIPLSIFIQNWKLFLSVWLVLAWLLFALINPFLEEGYWRGLLLDNTKHWPGWVGVLYSTFFFAINHPLTIGVYSIANRHPVVLISTFVMGLVWAVVYRKTHSLRWTIFAHMLTDLLNLSVLAFLNIVVPPSLPHH
ncbi:MAG: CPBP family intramembrane glutamic endopeptidase [Bacteroidota bacterium]